MKAGIVVAVTALALSGCMSLTRQDYLGAAVDPADYAAVRAGIERTADPHKGVINIRAPSAYYKAEMSDGAYLLRATRAPDGSLVNLQLYIKAQLIDWAFIDRAWSRGEQLDLTEVSRHAGGYYSGLAGVQEDVAINLTPEQLGEYARRGLETKIEGNQGSAVISVPATYFRAFRDALTAQ